jgi:hypothetical protein
MFYGSVSMTNIHSYETFQHRNETIFTKFYYHIFLNIAVLILFSCIFIVFCMYFKFKKTEVFKLNIHCHLFLRHYALRKWGERMGCEYLIAILYGLFLELLYSFSFNYELCVNCVHQIKVKRCI